MTDLIGFDDCANELQQASQEELKKIYSILGLDFEETPCEEDS